MKFVAFDLEIAEQLPEGTIDWSSVGKLGISCAATYDSDGELKVWHPVRAAGRYLARLSAMECWHMALWLKNKLEAGYVPVTYNGAGFDFRVLLREIGEGALFEQTIKHMALNHIDMAFAMLAEKGYMIGLDTAAKGMGLAGKTKGMSGKLAPEMWAGSLEEQEKVLEYVAQDARTTADLFEAVLKAGEIRWISRSGRRNTWRLPTAGLTVRCAMQRPEPDTSWMTAPWPRSKFVGWLE